MRKMKFDEAKIKKVILNLVGFNGEPSVMVGYDAIVHKRSNHAFHYDGCRF